MKKITLYSSIILFVGAIFFLIYFYYTRTIHLNRYRFFSAYIEKGTRIVVSCPNIEELISRHHRVCHYLECSSLVPDYLKYNQQMHSFESKKYDEFKDSKYSALLPKDSAVQYRTRFLNPSFIVFNTDIKSGAIVYNTVTPFFLENIDMIEEKCGINKIAQLEAYRQFGLKSQKRNPFGSVVLATEENLERLIETDLNLYDQSIFLDYISYSYAGTIITASGHGYASKYSSEKLRGEFYPYLFPRW